MPEIAEPTPMPDEPRFHAEYNRDYNGYVIRDRCGNHDVYNIGDPALARYIARVMTRVHEEWAAKWRHTLDVHGNLLLEARDELARVKAAIAEAKDAL